MKPYDWTWRVLHMETVLYPWDIGGCGQPVSWCLTWDIIHDVPHSSHFSINHKTWLDEDWPLACPNDLIREAEFILISCLRHKRSSATLLCNPCPKVWNCGYKYALEGFLEVISFMYINLALTVDAHWLLHTLRRKYGHVCRKSIKS
jgi:hypothetical protein